MRRIGVLPGTSAEDPESKAAPHGHSSKRYRNWVGSSAATYGIEYRFGGGDAAILRRLAEELVALAAGCHRVHRQFFDRGAYFRATSHRADRVTIVPDPVGSGFIGSLAQPGGNVTGFLQFEYSFGAKWLELLKEIAPSVSERQSSAIPPYPLGSASSASIQSVAPSLGVEVSPVNVRDAGEIERAVTAFARSPNSGLIVTASALAVVHRELIIALAARHKLPAVYFERFFVAAGGLISYGRLSTSSAARPATSIASSRARSQPTCRCRRRPSTSW